MNNCKKVAFINEKGGVGKSTCNWSVGYYEAITKGRRVLLVDCDSQRANLTFFAGIKKEDNLKTLYDVLYRDVDIREAIVNIKGSLDIIPATSDVSNITQTAKITKLKKEIAKIEEDYDLILFDVSPSPNWAHVLVLSTVSDVIITMLPDIASLEADLGIVESIQEIQDTTNPNLKVLGLLFNKNKSRTNLTKQVNIAANRMAEQLETTIFESKVRDSVALGECVASHIGITEYMPNSPVANDIIELSAEVEERLGI